MERTDLESTDDIEFSRLHATIYVESDISGKTRMGNHTV